MFRFSYFRPTRQHMMGKISYTQDRSPSVKSWTILDFGTRLVLCVLQISLGRLMCDAQQRQQLVTRVTNCALGISSTSYNLPVIKCVPPRRPSSIIDAAVINLCVYVYTNACQKGAWRYASCCVSQSRPSGWELIMEMIWTVKN
jgi:hypothetical protein